MYPLPKILFKFGCWIFISILTCCDDSLLSGERPRILFLKFPFGLLINPRICEEHQEGWKNDSRKKQKEKLIYFYYYYYLF